MCWKTSVHKRRPGSRVIDKGESVGREKHAEVNQLAPREEEMQREEKGGQVKLRNMKENITADQHFVGAWRER